MHCGGDDSGSEAIPDRLDRLDAGTDKLFRIGLQSVVEVVVGQAFRDQHQGVAREPDSPFREHTGEFDGTRMN